MKRLRLRKIWAVLAVMLLMAPLFRGSMEQSEATGVTQPSETESVPNPSSSYMIRFYANDNWDQGEEMPRFDLAPVEDTGGIFSWPSAAQVKMRVDVNGEEATHITTEYAKIEWVISVNGIEITDGGVADLNGFMIKEYTTGKTDTARTYDIQATGAGILDFYVNVYMYPTLNTPQNQAFHIDRHALITVPLQIKHSNGADPNPSYWDYTTVATGESIDLLVNNAASSHMHWYYYDFSTDEYIKLEDPKQVDTAQATITTGKYGLISGLRVDERDITDTPVQVNGRRNVFRYQANVNDSKAGMCRIVGRIYLNNDTRNTETYIEETFDTFIKAETKPTVVQNNYIVDMEYGKSVSFNSITNDAGGSLEWYLDGEATTRVQPTVVQLVNGQGAVGKYYGSETLYMSSLPYFAQWSTDRTLLRDLDLELRDYVTFKTAFCVLKGEVEEYRERSTGYEVVDVNGKLTLSTNVKGANGEYKYEWYWVDGSGAEVKFSEVENNDYIRVNGITTFGGDWSGITITGKKAGEVKIRCKVFESDGKTPIENGSKDITVKVVDSLVLSENRRTVVKGQSFEVTAETTDLTGTITWTSAEPEYVSVVSTGLRTATITGVEVTGDRYIEITATHAPSGRTAVCRVRVVDPISAVTIEGEKVIPKGSLSELWLEFTGNANGYSREDLHWVVKDKNGVDADTIIKLTPNDADPTKATVAGLEPGEAYVAITLSEVRGNDTVETELAVVTIKVVTTPEGIDIIEGPEIVDYLDNESITLHAVIQPKDYVEDDLTVLWRSSDESIATVAPSEDDSKVAVVTYLAPGKVRISATISTMQAIADFCDIDVQNPADGITLNPQELIMKVGTTAKVTATVTPEDTTDKTLTWEINNPDVATVTSSGGSECTVEAKKAGTAVITVTSSNGKSRQCVVTVLVPAESIVLNPSNITVKKNTIFYLSAQVLPAEAYDKSVTFTSSDEKIVTVEPDGTVTAVGVGVAEITVTSVDNPEITAICTVTVTEAVAGLTLNSREETIKVGEQFLLKATVHPSDAVNTAVTFESADPSIATVDENGLITGVKGGVTVIIVKTVERGLMATCTITVQEDITSITLSETETYVAKGKDKKLTATILPTSATKKKLLWTSSDESIVIVDHEGNIHGVNLGTAIITATAQDDGKVSATCKVTVVDETTEITLNQTIIRLMQNDTYQLTYTIKPDYATVKRVNWSTSNASVARVDSLGLVTAVGEGEAKIRATAADGSGVYAECTVIVVPLIPATSISVNTTETTMVVGDSRTLTARMLPRNTSEGVRWVSDDSSVIRIDNNGNATAVGAGVCHITAISSVSGLESVSTITVLGLNATEVTLEQYDTFDLYIDGVSQGVTWFSRNKRIATVSRRGLVTARREGTTDVVARVNGKMVSCAISVEKLKK